MPYDISVALYALIHQEYPAKNLANNVDFEGQRNHEDVHNFIKS